MLASDVKINRQKPFVGVDNEPIWYDVISSSFCVVVAAAKLSRNRKVVWPSFTRRDQQPKSVCIYGP